MKKVLIAAAVVAAVGGGGWYFLSKSGSGGAGSAAGILEYVPADTPYVLASTEPLPQQAINHMLGDTDALIELYRLQLAQLEELANQPEKSDDADADDEQITAEAEAAVDEAVDAMSDQADSDQTEQTEEALAADEKIAAEAKAKLAENSATIRKIGNAILDEFAAADKNAPEKTLGISFQSAYAMYGIGLIPAARIEVKNEQAMREMIARVEKKSGQSMEVGKLGELSYWKIAEADKGVTPVAAIVDGYLVMGLAPIDSEEGLRTLFGLNKPAKSLLASGRLNDLGKRYQYLPQMLGYIDTQVMVNRVVNEQNALEKAIFKDELPKLNDVCRSEIQAMAANVPLMGVGYTSIADNKFDAHSFVEIKPEIAADLKKFSVPMPTAAGGAGKLIDFGIAFNLEALPAFVNKYAKAVADNPWQCEHFKDINKTFSDAQTGAGAMIAFASYANSLRVSLDSFDMGAGVPNMTGKILVGSGNPAALVALAGSTLPSLAGLTADGKAVPVELPPMAGLPPDTKVFAAMSEKVIGLSLGENSTDGLIKAVNTAPADQGFLSYGLSSAFYKQMFDLGSQLPGSAQPSDNDREQMELLKRMMSKSFNRIDMQTQFTDRGIETTISMDYPK